ncbi:hypothetical protein D3C86_1424430 [compost metagenome]
MQQLLAQGFDALAGHARQRNQRCIGIGSGRQQGTDLLAHVLHPGAVDPVALAYRYQCPRDAQQLDNRQVLAGLRHHPVIGGHHQQHQIDALRPGQHVVGEALMAGNVDETGQRRIRLQRGIQVAEVDGHATFTLFAAPVTRLPGQRLE